MNPRAIAFFASAAAVFAAGLPAGFQPNSGRFDRRISFVAQGSEYGVSLEPGAIRFLLTGKDRRTGAVVLRFPGSRAVEAAADGPSLGQVNYLIGSDPEHWIWNLQEYARVRYPDLYRGIDLAIYDNGGRLEHDFIVKPGAEPAAIALAFTGAKGLRLGRDGALLIRTLGGELRFEPPALYQEIDGKKLPVDGRYNLDPSRRTVRFDVGAYDRTRELVIDPTVVFTVNLTGSGVQTGEAVASDAQGNLYIAGVTTSPDLQLLNPVQTAYGGGDSDCFVAKWDSTGNLIYVTYLGGSHQEQPQQILVDAEGNVVVLGSTHSSDFPSVNPLPSGGYSPPGPDTLNGKAITFIAKLDPTGSKLVYSTLLWSNNAQAYNATGMALDRAGNAYVTGFDVLAATGAVGSPRLAPTAGAYKSPNLAAGFNHVWVAKLSPSGALLWDAVIGGSNQEQASGVDVDSAGNVYIAGFTGSKDFPVTPNNGVQQSLTSKQAGNAFLAVLNPAGSQLVYATYFGGSGTDIGNAVAVIPGEGVAIGGLTTSPDLPVTSDAFQTTLQNMPGGFYAVINPPGLTIPASDTISGRGTVHTQAGASSPGLVNVTYLTSPAVRMVNYSTNTKARIFYEFIVTVDTGGNVTSVVEREHIDYQDGKPPIVVTHQFKPVQGTKNIAAYLARFQVGEIFVDVTGSFPATTPLPQGKVRVPHPLDTLGVQAIGLRLVEGLAITNAASFATTAISPGEIVTIFGNNLGPSTLTSAQLDSTGQKLSTSVAGTQVFFDTDPAPIVYTSAGQVSVIVPYSVQGKTSVSVLPYFNGTLQDAAAINVAPTAPGIFTADGKQAAALNQDGGYNSPSSPAPRGSTVVLFATGEGQTNPPGIDGQLAISTLPQPVPPVSVTIGGQPATVAYYGAAPGLTAGLMQLNVVVPQNISAGAAAVILTVGTVTSQAGVTIAVN